MKYLWLCQPRIKKSTASGGGNKVEQIIKQGYIVTIKLSCQSVTSGMTDICKCRIITMYNKSYNKWFITGEKNYWYIDLEKNENKNFKVGARIIDNKVLGYEDVPLGDHVHLSKYIIRLFDGTMVVSLVGIISRA